MNSVPTYTATIYVGLREGYTDKVHHALDVRELCQKYCDEIGLCVTVTTLNFIYKSGSDPGVAIGLINYPRFPSEKWKIREQAIELAVQCKNRFNQNRISIVFPDDTVMIGDTE